MSKKSSKAMTPNSNMNPAQSTSNKMGATGPEQEKDWKGYFERRFPQDPMKVQQMMRQVALYEGF